MPTLCSPSASITDLRSGEHWSAAHLAGETDSRADSLACLGLRPGRFVVLAHGGTPAFFADLFAVWEWGACAVCVNPESTPYELEHIVDFLRPLAVLVGEESPAASGLRTGVPVLRSGQHASRAQREAGMRRKPALDGRALVLFTSGSTGRPKAVVHSLRSVLTRIALNRAHIGDRKLRRVLNVLPTHFGHGLIGNCLTALLAGARLHLLPRPEIKEMAETGSVLTDHRITFMSSVPAFWRMLLKVGRPPRAASLEQVHVGSAPLSAELWRSIAAWCGTNNVLNMYGITEAANWIAGASARDHVVCDGLVGRPWGGAAAVLDAGGLIRPAGDGELLVQSPSLMTGYYRRPHLTRRAFIDGWYRTGDVGSVDGDGVIRISGRQKSEINCAGVKVHPEELDVLLERHPRVLEACAFGVPDEVAGEVVAAAVRPADGSLTGEELRRWCASRIRPDAIPVRWYIVAEVPRTDGGKVNRDAVRAYCHDRRER